MLSDRQIAAISEAGTIVAGFIASGGAALRDTTQSRGEGLSLASRTALRWSREIMMAFLTATRMDGPPADDTDAAARDVVCEAIGAIDRLLAALDAAGKEAN